LDVSSLVQNGDTAMYRAKDAGRNTYRFYTPQMNHRAIEKLDTDGALRKALERNEFASLSTKSHARDRTHSGRRSAAALASSRARPGSTARFRPDSRGNRTDHCGRQLGHTNRL
jgi:hypothetical protein